MNRNNIHYRTRNFEYDRPGVYHVINRIAFAEFRLESVEREVLVKSMRKLAAFCGLEVLAYCVLSNHFHLLVRVSPAPVDGITDIEILRRYRCLYSDNDPPSPYRPRPKELEQILQKNDADADIHRKRLCARMHDLPIFIKELKQRFTRWYNRSNEGFGTIWAERYKCLLIEDSPDVMRIVAAYIELNPVRAGLAHEPEDYRWCSLAAATAGQRFARAGIQHITGWKSWRKAHASYRLYIYGVGSSGKQPGGARIAKSRANQVIAADGHAGMAELLRRRARYFSDGAILGSQEFIRSFIARNGSRFSHRKRKEGHPCGNDSALNGFHALRELRDEKLPTNPSSQ